MNIAIHEIAEGIIDHPMTLKPPVSLEDRRYNGDFKVSLAVSGPFMARV